MKTALVILGLLFGILAVWALIETFVSSKKSVTKRKSHAKPAAGADPQSLIATDPYGAGKMRRGVRDTVPPGQRFH